MKTLRFLLALTTQNNDYQIEQATSARAAAKNVGAELEIVYAEIRGIGVRDVNGDNRNVRLLEDVGPDERGQHGGRERIQSHVNLLVVREQPRKVSPEYRGFFEVAFGVTAQHASRRDDTRQDV